jgi:hypothetical protein
MMELSVPKPANCREQLLSIVTIQHSDSAVFIKYFTDHHQIPTAKTDNKLFIMRLFIKQGFGMKNAA